LKRGDLLPVPLSPGYMITILKRYLPLTTTPILDSDEVLYYVDGDFMSRNHVEKGQITLHPIGIPHGPHPGAVERSIGEVATNELAVMVDTFAPLNITEQALQIEDKDYFKSWL